jgi:hypothetical protein
MRIIVLNHIVILYHEAAGRQAASKDRRRPLGCGPAMFWGGEPEWIAKLRGTHGGNTGGRQPCRRGREPTRDLGAAQQFKAFRQRLPRPSDWHRLGGLNLPAPSDRLILCRISAIEAGRSRMNSSRGRQRSTGGSPVLLRPDGHHPHLLDLDR